MTVSSLSYLSLLYLLTVSIFSFLLLNKSDIISLRVLSLDFIYVSDINESIVSVINSKEERFLDYRPVSSRISE